MGIENLHSGCYVVCKYDDISPYGRMVMSYKTEQEARERLLELCEENGVEEEQWIWKPLHNLNDKDKWKSTNTIESLEKYTQGE